MSDNSMLSKAQVDRTVSIGVLRDCLTMSNRLKRGQKVGFHVFGALQKHCVFSVIRFSDTTR
jgi:hypothetical protein